MHARWGGSLAGGRDVGRRPLMDAPNQAGCMRRWSKRRRFATSRARRAAFLRPCRDAGEKKSPVGLHCNACAVSWTDNASVHGDLERAEPLDGRHVRRSEYLCIREHALPESLARACRCEMKRMLRRGGEVSGRGGVRGLWREGGRKGSGGRWDEGWRGNRGPQMWSMGWSHSHRREGIGTETRRAGV